MIPTKLLTDILQEVINNDTIKIKNSISMLKNLCNFAKHVKRLICD